MVVVVGGGLSWFDYEGSDDDDGGGGGCPGWMVILASCGPDDGDHSDGYGDVDSTSW